MECTAVILFHVEPMRPVKLKGKPFDQSIEYASSHRDHKGLGIAFVVMLRTEPEWRLSFYDQKNREHFGVELSRLEEAETALIGWNAVGYQNKIIEAVWGEMMPQSVCYDPLRWIWKAVGLDPDKFDVAKHPNYSLDGLCSANGIPKPVRVGSPGAWQKGHMAEVLTAGVDRLRALRALVGATTTERWIDPANGHEVPAVVSPVEALMLEER